MDCKSYNENLRKAFLYTIVVLAIFIFTGLFSVNYIRELTGANCLLAIITVPCCILHYNSDKNSSFFIYILIYTSTCVEFIFKWYLASYNIYISDLLFPFIYRIFLLSLLLYTNSNFIKKCMKHTKFIFSISLLIDFLLVVFNYYINKNTTIYLYLKPLFYICALIAYIVIIKLTIATHKKKNFVLTIYNISVIIIAVRLFFMFIFDLLNISQNIITGDKTLFFISLLILLIGLFIQINEILKINKVLDRDVRIISANAKEIQELGQMQSYFFANLSHELKTPLNLISSALQLLNLNKNKSDEDFIYSYNKYEPSLQQNIYRMIRLTNNFVDISKINAGFIKLKFKNYNIVELVENITMSVLFYIEAKNLNIIFDTDDEEIYIKCDSDAIERIILNLLSNAIKFAKENSNILVTVSSDKDYVYIKVKDDGPGIMPEFKEHVFKMYFQTDKSLRREKEGSGIGLSLVYSLVRLHDGYVYIEDTDIGTEVVVKIPNKKLPDDDAENYVTNINSQSKCLIEKINIEFSDIYEINKK